MSNKKLKKSVYKKFIFKVLKYYLIINYYFIFSPFFKMFIILFYLLKIEKKVHMFFILLKKILIKWKIIYMPKIYF